VQCLLVQVSPNECVCSTLSCIDCCLESFLCEDGKECFTICSVLSLPSYVCDGTVMSTNDMLNSKRMSILRTNLPLSCCATVPDNTERSVVVAIHLPEDISRVEKVR